MRDLIIEKSSLEELWSVVRPVFEG